MSEYRTPFGGFVGYTATGDVVAERTLEWDDPNGPSVGILHYNIYESILGPDPSSGDFQLLVKIPVPEKETTVTFDPGSDRWYFATASNRDTEADPSNVVKATAVKPASLILRIK